MNARAQITFTTMPQKRVATDPKSLYGFVSPKPLAGGYLIQGRLKVRHRSAGAAMLVPVLSGLLPFVGRPRCHC